MSLLVKLLRKRLFLVFITIISNGILVGVMLWWNAQLIGIIDIISGGNRLSTNAIMSAIFIMVVMGVANFIKVYISGFTCETLTHDMRMGYARYFSNIPVAEVENLNVGEQLSQLQNEIADVSRYLNGNLFQLLSDSMNFIFTFAWLMIINARLTIIVNLPVLLIMVYVFYSSKIISTATERSQQIKGQMNIYADTLLTLFPIIRLFDASRMMVERYNSEVSEWEKQTVHAERLRARLMSLSGLLSNIPLMLLFFVGGGMVINNILTIGTLYIFLNLSGNVSGVMMNMPGFIASFRQFSVNMKRLSPKVMLDVRIQSA